VTFPTLRLISLTVGGLAVLAGCSMPEGQMVSGVPASVSPVAGLQNDLPKPTAPALVPGTGAIPASRPAIPVSSLVGRSGADVMSMIGTPTLKWQRGQGALWQYAAQPCVVHVFLAGDGESATVQQVVSRPRSTQKSTECPGEILPEG